MAYNSGTENLLIPGGACIKLPRWLHESERYAPVIDMSTEANGRVRAEARSTGAIRFFQKPVDAQSLIDANEWALGGAELRRCAIPSAAEETL